jgi:hypothetical protein
MIAARGRRGTVATEWPSRQRPDPASRRDRGLKPPFRALAGLKTKAVRRIVGNALKSNGPESTAKNTENGAVPTGPAGP